jgi:hypothetical protein
MQFLLPGTYTLTISARGFKTARGGQIELQAPISSKSISTWSA